MNNSLDESILRQSLEESNKVIDDISETEPTFIKRVEIAKLQTVHKFDLIWKEYRCADGCNIMSQNRYLHIKNITLHLKSDNPWFTKYHRYEYVRLSITYKSRDGEEKKYDVSLNSYIKLAWCVYGNGKRVSYNLQNNTVCVNLELLFVDPFAVTNDVTFMISDSYDPACFGEIRFEYVYLSRKSSVSRLLTCRHYYHGLFNHDDNILSYPKLFMFWYTKEENGKYLEEKIENSFGWYRKIVEGSGWRDDNVLVCPISEKNEFVGDDLVEFCTKITNKEKEHELFQNAIKVFDALNIDKNQVRVVMLLVIER